jgi:DNA topoisomerase VI subunit B
MSAPVLQRTTFETSRLLEFFTEKELQMQTGYPAPLWPIALVKELIDNALDACESANIRPEITVSIESDSVSVADNGPGIPSSTIERSLDYFISVSDKAHYVSPTRGQLGNALKCVWAAPYVASGQVAGHIEVSTCGQTHYVDVTLDRIAQTPNLAHRVETDGLVKNGTLVRMHWPEIAVDCSIRDTGAILT